MINRIYRYLRYKYLKILRLPDSTHKVSLGVALGISFNFLPTFGLGLIFAFLTACLIKANKAAAILSAVAVKIGIPFFYMADMATGHFLLNDSAGINEKIPDFSFSNIIEMISNHDFLKQLGQAFVLGSVVNAIIVGIIAYYIVKRFLVNHKMKRRKKKG